MAATSRIPYTSQAEVLDPVTMRVEGDIPSWLNGQLVRIGPGLFEFGEFEAALPMDGMGLLHAFNIQDGGVTFKSRFVSSDILKKNSEAKRFVCAEFGTPVSPDPSKGRFAKLKSMIKGDAELSDNVNHNICYWKEADVLLAIGLPMFVLDPVTLEHRMKVTLPESLGVDIVSEHVHIDKDGCLYLLGSHVRGRPSYHVVRVPPKGDVMSSFAAAELVFTVPGQYKVTPTSHHTFFMTENFFVIIECPLEINVLKILTKGTIQEALKWDPSVTCKFHVFNRRTGRPIPQKIESDSFLLMHSSNAYEYGDHLVLDMFNLRDLEFKDWFVPRKTMAQPNFDPTAAGSSSKESPPLRFVIPTNEDKITKADKGANLVKLESEQAEAVKQSSSLLRLRSRPLCAGDGLQFPCINTAVTGKPYSFLYAGGYGESKCLEFAIGKFDVKTKEMTSWEAEKKQFLSEPVFVANPAGSSEDDGVLLVSMLDYATGKDRLIVLDATSMSVLAQVYFPEDCSICIPEADHGLFLSGSA